MSPKGHKAYVRDSEKRMQALVDYERGHPVGAIAFRRGLSAATICKYAREAGIMRKGPYRKVLKWRWWKK